MRTLLALIGRIIGELLMCDIIDEILLTLNINQHRRTKVSYKIKHLETSNADQELIPFSLMNS